MDRLAERNIGADRIKDIIQRTGKYGLQFQYMVAAIDQVVHRIEDREAGAYVRLEQELDVSVAGGLLELGIIIVGGGGRFFISRHDGYVIVHQRLVKSRHVRACRAIHEYGVEDIHLYDLFAQMLRVALFPVLLQLLQIIVEVDPFPA